MTLRDLKKIYLNNCTNLSLPQSAFTVAILESSSIDFLPQATFDALLQLEPEAEKKPFALIEEGNQLLALALVRMLAESVPTSYEEWLQTKINHYIKTNAWTEFQLLSVLKAILANLTDQPFQPHPPQQLERGAAFFEWKGMWSWGKIPHGYLHADLGCLWGIYGYLSQDNTWIEAAKKLANWQLNTLQSDFLPVRSLFTHEENASFHQHLISNYLLFSVVAALVGDKQLKFAAQMQLEHLNACEQVKVARHSLFIEAFFQRIEGTVQPQEFKLASWINDPEVGIQGFRSQDETVFCLGKGGQTGLGYLSFSDVGIVNYGPQHFPLGDCRTFGIEESDSTTYRSELLSSEMYLASTAKLTPKQVDLESFANYRNGFSNNIWIDLKHKFNLEAKKLTISANFFSAEEMQEELAFVFFVKADSCHLDKQRPIYSKTFVHFQGVETSIKFERNQSSFFLTTSEPLKMEIIPLSGGDNFWGADFLVAYLLNSSNSIEWNVTKSN